MLSSLAAMDSHILAATPAWMSTAWAYLLVIFGFSVVVFVHELGHFAAAKWAKVRVERFAIGFGRELFGFDYGETRYSFNILPLGGYVKMLGQEDFVVDKSGELKVKDNPDAFTGKSIGKRMVIVSAGVIMNLIFAAALFTIVNMVGTPQSPALLGYVVENSPASRAGLLPGDRILEINGDEIANFNELMQRVILSGPDEALTMRVERDGKIVSPAPQIRPEYVADREVRQIGAAPMQTRRVWGSAFSDITTARPDELHERDEITAVIVDGKPVECRDAGLVRREMMRAEGQPIELIVKRPKDPTALTDEQLIAENPAIESSVERAKTRAMWLPLPYDPGDRSGASLLGLVPRLTILAVEEGKSFAIAGAKAGDVIVRVGKHFYPTYAELESEIRDAGSAGVEIDVRRRGVEHDGMSPAAMAFCERYREDLIRAGLEDFAKARDRLKEFSKSAGLSDADQTAVQSATGSLGNGEAWRKWFEGIDIVSLKPLAPAAPFALFSRPPVTIDAEIRNIDEDHLVVASIVDKFGDRVTAAKAAGFERGAVILTVNGRRVREWYEFSHVLRANAGKDVEIEYRLVDRIVKTRMKIPDCIEAALNLGVEDRIVSIDGKTSCVLERAGATAITAALPDWRAIEQILNQSVGKTVNVEYITPQGDRRNGEFAVRADNTDPWLARVQYYAMTFVCYPLFETQSIANPVKALIVGIKQAHRATMATIQTIRHMLLTRNVGLSNVSGPLGIAHKGSQVAEGGLIALFWFLGLISANLAVINFLPLPIVDGGLFIFLLLEKIRGEPVSIKTQVATQLLGIVLIATVFVLVTYQDFLRMFTQT